MTAIGTSAARISRRGARDQIISQMTRVVPMPARPAIEVPRA
jgi:hypothetical protein